MLTPRFTKVTLSLLYFYMEIPMNKFIPVKVGAYTANDQSVKLLI